MSNGNQAPTRGQRLDGFYTALRRPGIVRSSSARWFAGVSTGIARWLGVDPLVVRAGFILLSIFFGVGVGLYLVLWLLMPDDRGRLPVERALRDGDGGSIVLLVITVMSVLGGGPWWGGDFHALRLVGFGLLVAGAWWFLTRTDTGRDLMDTKPWRGGHRSTGNAAANAGAAQLTPTSVVGPGASAPEPRERVRGIGFAGGMAALGVAIVAGAVLHQIAVAGQWSGNALAVGIAGGVAVLGLVIVVAGLAGRRAGALAIVTVVGMLAAIAVTSAPAGLTRPFEVGDSRHVVTSLANGSDFQLGLGDMVVDLTSADHASTPVNPDVVTATVGMGQLDIIVPKGVSVAVQTHARLGEITAPTTSAATAATGTAGDGQTQRDGTDVSATLTFGPAGATPQILVDAQVGLGQINVRSAS